MIQYWKDWSYVCQGLRVAYFNLPIYSVSSFTFILIGLFLFNMQVHKNCLLLSIAKDCSFKRLLFIVFGINDTILQKKDLLVSHTIQKSLVQENSPMRWCVMMLLVPWIFSSLHSNSWFYNATVPLNSATAVFFKCSCIGLQWRLVFLITLVQYRLVSLYNK